MKNLFSIGEVSKIKGITIKALRYYQKVGILSPKYIDESTGYRYYSIEQFVYIDIIKACRELGTSIKELQDIFKKCDMENLIEFLDKKRSEAEENIIKMKEIIKNIDTLKDGVEHSKDILLKEDIEIKNFKERYIVIAPCSESGDLKELLYFSNLNKIIKDNNIDITMEQGIIYDVLKEDQVKPKYVFRVIKDTKNIKENDFIKKLPRGDYLTLSYKKENESERVKKIGEYAKDNNLEIKSFMEFDLFDDLFNIDSYSCQIQILL